MDNKNNNQNFEDLIMKEIKCGHIKLRSKYIFVAEKLGLSGGLLLSVLLAVFFLNLGMFYMKSMDNLEYLSFGKDGILAFLESFPYHWILISLLFIFSSGYFISRYDLSYKKPFKFIVIGMTLFIVCSGGVIAATGVNDYLEGTVLTDNQNKMLKPFYGMKPVERPHGTVGRVQEISKGYMLIGTPFGEKLINITKINKNNLDSVDIGNFVLLVGEVKDNHFYATGIKRIDDREAMGMKKRIMIEFAEDEFRIIEGEVRQFQDRKMRVCFRQCSGSTTVHDLGGCVKGCH